MFGERLRMGVAALEREDRGLCRGGGGEREDRGPRRSGREGRGGGEREDRGPRAAAEEESARSESCMRSMGMLSLERNRSAAHGEGGLVVGERRHLVWFCSMVMNSKL